MSLPLHDPRVRALLALGAFVLVLLLSWGFNSSQQQIKRLQHQEDAAQKELLRLQKALQQVAQLQGRLPKSSQDSPNQPRPNLIAVVEQLSQRVGARKALVYVRPQPDREIKGQIQKRVEIKLEKLQLEQLVELLYHFDQPQQQLHTEQLRLRKRFDDSSLLDAVIILSRLRGELS